MSNISEVVIVGDNLLAKALYEASRQSSFRVHLNDVGELRHADLIIETENKDRDLKKETIQKIESSIDAETTILSTSLRLPATEIASWLDHSERLVGFGTFANLNDIELIEIARALQTDPSHIRVVEEFFQSLGKETEEVEDEVGLVFPRILCMIINEAAFALTEKTANVRDIDEAMKKGTNYPHGPLEWAEKIGLEDVYAVLKGLFEQLGEDRYRPAPLIRKLIYAGWTGAETEKGFYYYEDRLRGEVMT